MKYISYLVKASLQDFKRNKIRTFLTSLGILIGVLSVVLMMAFGFGLKDYINEQFETLGKNLVIVLPGAGFTSGGAGLIGGVEFDEKDLNNLKRIKNVAAIAPAFAKSVKIEANGEAEPTNLRGTTTDILELLNLDFDKGHMFTEADFARKRKVVVIGGSVAEKLFKTASNSIGKTVRIQSQRFTVIGVLKKEGSITSEVDTITIAPYTSLVSINPNKKFFAIYLKSTTDGTVFQVKKDVKTVLLRRYKEDDFSVTEQTELLDTVNSIVGILNIALIAIGSISLIVGGIGIMNIMYATVTERTREVGVRRAMGATRKDILYQFLTGAVMVSALGGLAAVIIAAIIVYAIQAFFPAIINAFSVIVAFGISSAVGIFFGVFPAKKAADLSPVEAMRYE